MRSHPDGIVLYLHIMQINETCVTLKHKKRTLTYVDNQNIPNTTGHIWTARNMINNVRNYVEHPVFSEVRFTRSLVLCTCFVDRCPFAILLLVIVLSVLLRFMDYDCPFGICKLF